MFVTEENGINRQIVVNLSLWCYLISLWNRWLSIFNIVIQNNIMLDNQQYKYNTQYKNI